ncbi:NYN domain-containing protein [Salinibacterium sp. NSLL150]|uniref:NYN domain-containing protein n=1 Tax=unclassified Salinibacterium TaxID=2632331 RepID=UPI0018CE087A|nr:MULTISPECIES: NYN domain-containing protein [unclassified Salinibacterium]MBH0099295.1 NYN domain-containing protein [Salinibacterium sp. NSLL35]MBH0102049.1 NYN domain-containing protein [Salinibacterium sp. NSLL150]MBH0104809.1 NYN domain-containing protein [Salinibacterium sp. NSLL16]MBH0107569.1 NYN domain-containing protein [Salinibacterium sp. NSLL17]
MATVTEGRVAVYIDFDNIVISRYNQIHGNGQFSKDKARFFTSIRAATSAISAKLLEANVDVEAILDYASSFGTVAFSRAYADWSVPVNASYQKQLINRAVELVQLFPLTAQMKNGADIRLSVDAMEDMFRLPDITHVVIVAGDSDYVALAQRAKTLGRYVIGIGVAGGTSDALTSSCDKFADYDSLPGVEFATQTASPQATETMQPTTPPMSPQPAVATAPVATGATNVAEPAASHEAEVSTAKKATAPPQAGPAKAGTAKKTVGIAKTTTQPLADAPANGMRPFKMLVRALRLVQQKEDSEWLNSSGVKNQMLRIDPSFNEAALGFKTFSEFVASHSSHVEMREREGVRELRLRANATQLK